MSIPLCCLASLFLWRPRRLLPSRVPRSVFFCNGVVSSDVAKPGELASFDCCQQGLLLSSKGVYLLSHIFVCLVFNVRNRSLLKHFVSVCKSLSVSAVRVQLSHP